MLERPIYSLIYYVPAPQLELTKQALFDAGAGTIGNYDQCCWQVLGQGQFRPLEGSNPFTGSLQQSSKIEEYRVELVVAKENIEAVIQALRNSHPYETPAYHVLSVEDF